MPLVTSTINLRSEARIMESFPDSVLLLVDDVKRKINSMNPSTECQVLFK